MGGTIGININKKQKHMKNKLELVNHNKNGKVTNRGRRKIAVDLPKGNSFTISQLVEANPQIECRATIYTRVGEMVKAKILTKTKEVLQTGTVGKPGTLYWKTGAWNSRQALLARNKARASQKKLASVPAVDLTPAPEPVTA